MDSHFSNPSFYLPSCTHIPLFGPITLSLLYRRPLRRSSWTCITAYTFIIHNIKHTHTGRLCIIVFSFSHLLLSGTPFIYFYTPFSLPRFPPPALLRCFETVCLVTFHQSRIHDWYVLDLDLTSLSVWHHSLPSIRYLPVSVCIYIRSDSDMRRFGWHSNYVLQDHALCVFESSVLHRVCLISRCMPSTSVHIFN